MPKNSVLEWDATAANNTDIAGINIQGSAAVSNFDNALRTVMAQVKSGLDYKQVYSVKTGNYTALTTDNNAFFRFTATATLTFSTAATLGANWHCDVIADGITLTVDPNGTELIDGVSSIILPSGTYCRIFCDGTGFRTSQPENSPTFRRVGIIDITSATASIDLALPSWARQVRISGHFVPVTSGAQLLMRVAVGGVFNSTAGAYLQQYVRGDNTTLDGARDIATQTGFILLPASSNASTGGGSFTFALSEANQSRYKYSTGNASYLNAGGNIQAASFAQSFISANPLTDIRFIPSTGNISILHAVVEASR